MIVRADNMCHERGLPSLADASVDAIVTDPPAGIAFMGKAWDTDKGGRDQWIAWLAGVMRECLRVLKPGGHALVWALPRTSHWTATAVEDAGFEIRDVVMHLFGTGFPKSKNIGGGFGTALKPAAEHWILARKPLDGTVAANVLAHGTGALNIDGTRIAGEPDLDTRRNSAGGDNGLNGTSTYKIRARSADEQPLTLGRWPANVTLDEEAARSLDEQSGVTSARNGKRRLSALGAMNDDGWVAREQQQQQYRDSGGASRFFYVAKGSRAEKTHGGTVDNKHPTVKSIALMRWLVRLITPPGGLVLDPFAGSGTTGVAALAEGMRFMGMERDEQYAEIAAARLRQSEAA